MNSNFINFTELQKIRVETDPFPYAIIPNFIDPNCLSTLVSAFPQIAHRGSIPASSAICSPVFKQFLDELEGALFREIIEQKFAIDLRDKPTMTTLRGYTTKRDGHIHTDSKDKLITVLIYMNENWNRTDGNLRILRNRYSLDDYVAEVPANAGTCLIFKVTPNGWHGHKIFTGKRLSLQFNYLTNDVALTKHLNNHGLSAKFKRLFPWLFNRSNY